MIDFHCHLDLYPKPSQVVGHCLERRMYVLSVTTTPSAWRGTNALIPSGTRIRTALGMHPQLAYERRGELDLFDETLIKTRYVGEIGLDGSPELSNHWAEQIQVFEHILNSCSKAGGRIMSIHSRRASRSVLDCLEKYPGAGVPVLHWFSGSLRELERAVVIGSWFSVGPAMLRTRKGLALATQMPRDRILTESDGPFALLNRVSLMPWQVHDATDRLAKIWNVAPQAAEEIVIDNFRRLVQLI